MDASRCISYLTIEKRGVIPLELRAGMGRNVFGCDICQDVCPWNATPTSGSSLGTPGRRAPVSTAPEFNAADHDALRSGESGSGEGRWVNPELRRLARLSPVEFRAAFRRSPVKRAKYQGLMRNIIIAMGNSGDLSSLADLERFAQAEDPVLREHALWAIGRLLEGR
jgi:epoxyqueuosine reductase